MSVNTPLVSVFAGPSGGHLCPAAAFAESLKKKTPSCRLHLITGARGRPLAMRLAEGVFDEIIGLADFPFPSHFAASWSFPWRLLGAFSCTRRYLASVRPSLCVGFGSYISFPGIFLAGLKKIPTLIHEQNVRPGLATRCVAGRADCVAVTFETTFDGVKEMRREAVGLPIRSALCEAAKRSRAPSEKGMRLLVIGGSQGAHRLNQLVSEALASLSDEEKKQMAVTHITGSGDFAWITEAYKRLGMRFQTEPFCDRIHELYGRADLAVTRAGANTLFELALFRIPAIVIPYRHAGGHQADNAAYFAARGAVMARSEDEIGADGLGEIVRSFMRQPGNLQMQAEKIGRLAQPEAAGRMAALAMEFLSERH